MVRVWKCYMIDRRPGAPALKRDVTALYDASASVAPQDAGGAIGQGALRLVDLDKMPDLNPDDLCEFWEGWIDPTNDHFDESLEHCGYFVQAHTNHFEGGARHCFEATTADYNLLLDTTPVVTWPTDLTAGATAAGYPAGYSVKDWFVGRVSAGKPYDGVIAFHFPYSGRIDFGGVDAVFDTLLLDDQHLPTMSNVDSPELFGAFGFIGLRELCDEILKYGRFAAADAGLDVAPSYFFRAIVRPDDPTKIQPQFCLVDLNNDAGTGTPIGRYSIDPDIGGGIYAIEELEHERDARSVRTEVIVMADGDRADGFIWSARDKAEGVAAYPAYYHRRGHWGGPPILNPDIQYQDQADELAQRAVDLLWGPRGRLRWKTRGPRALKQGDLVELHFPPEGQDHHILPALEVRRIPRVGTWLMQITAGERDLQIDDLLFPRAATPMILPAAPGGSSRGGTTAGDFAGGASVPAPRQRPVQNIAMQPLQNVVQGINNRVPTLDLRQNPQTVDSGLEVPTALPAADISRLGSIWDAVGLAWRKKVWVDGFGTPHKQKLSMFFETDRTIWINVHERMTIRAAQKSNDPAQGATTFTITRNHTGTVTTVATVNGAGTLSAAFELQPGDELAITAASVPTGTGGHATLTLVSGDPL